MPPILSWLFAVVMLGFACLVIINRNPVASALSLVVSFLAMAALFVSLDAYFIGVIEVLVYAGAVMVLFLFIIMLLDIRAEARRRFNIVPTVGGLLVALAFVYQLVVVIHRFPAGDKPFPALATANFDDVHNVGVMLFSRYNLPFQVVGALVLVSTIGVVVLSKKGLK